MEEPMDYLEFENALQLVDSVKVLSEATADSPNLADLNCASIFRMIQFVLENAELPLRKALDEMIETDQSVSDTEHSVFDTDSRQKEDGFFTGD
jgi:hypothetical protein